MDVEYTVPSYTDEYIESHYGQAEQGSGKRFTTRDLTASMQRASKGQLYEWKGVRPVATRCWAYTRDKMQEFEKQGRLVYGDAGVPRLKLYLDDMPGVPCDTVWTDIPPINSQAVERLGYPTQKPIALLDRIIKASSNSGDLILDAFCGCGTALVSAQNLGRRWIGIDISPTACRVMAKRLRKDCGLIEGKNFVVRDLPWSEEQLRKIPPFEFENWAVIALGGIKNKVQVGDMGIDGRIYPAHATPKGGKKAGELGFMDVWYPIQVKQKDKAGRPDIDSFEAVMLREDRTKGFFVSFDYSHDAMTEVDAFFRRSGRVIVPLTVREILEEEIAAKLA